MKKEKEAPKIEAKEPDVTKLTEAIEATVVSLTEVMAKEVAFLSKRDFNSMLALREEKARLFRDHQAHIAVLVQKPDILKKAPLEKQEELRKKWAELDLIGRRNMASFNAAIRATKGVLEMVMDTVRAENKKTDSYTDPRIVRNTKGKYSPISQPVAVDRMA